jgi:hypothetical protein
VPGAIEVIVEERVPVFSVGLGNPAREIVDSVHAYGGRVVAMVTTPDAARAVAANGVDVVIAQGSEAGGHRSDWRKPQTVQHNAIGTMSLVPDVVRSRCAGPGRRRHHERSRRDRRTGAGCAGRPGLYTPPNATHSVYSKTGCVMLFVVPEEVEVLKLLTDEST